MMLEACQKPASDEENMVKCLRELTTKYSAKAVNKRLNAMISKPVVKVSTVRCLKNNKKSLVENYGIIESSDERLEVPNKQLVSNAVKAIQALTGDVKQVDSGQSLITTEDEIRSEGCYVKCVDFKVESTGKRYNKRGSCSVNRVEVESINYESSDMDEQEFTELIKNMVIKEYGDLKADLI